MSSAVVSTLPTSTTNITGFLTMPRGSSLRTESISACPRISVFQRDFLSSMISPFQLIQMRYELENLTCLEQQVFQNGTQAKCREEGQRAENQNHADEQNSEEGTVHRESSRRRRNALLRSQIACQGEHGDHHEEAPAEHGPTHGRVVPPERRRIDAGIESGEGRSVVTHCRGVSVENLSKPVRPRIRQGG